jgi:hypothetical protein
MSAPNLGITVEPLESGKVVFLPLAPSKSGLKEKGRLLLLLTIKNKEASKVKMKDLKLSFSGPSQAGTTIPLQFIDGDGNSSVFEIAAGATRQWSFQKPDQDVILSTPFPTQITLEVSCQGFTSPAAVTLPLAAHKSPTPEGNYLFPASASDLRQGEYWSTEGDTHGIGSAGSQIFAYDMGVIAFDGGWTDRLPGTTGSKNSDRRIWGKPVRAMAAGTVLHALNGVPNNPKPLSWTSQEDLDTKMQEQRDKFWGTFENGGAGNHVYIQHGDEVILYAHLQKGSLPAKIKKGATVAAGERLGLAGNSGNSTGPHLHIHAIQGTEAEKGPLRPTPFRNAWVVDRTAINPPDPKGPWTAMKGQGIPEVASVIWPAATAPAWYPPDWAEIARHGIPEASYQLEFDKIASSGYRLVWVDGYEVNGKTFFNVIFRPADGTAWVARHGLNAAAYQKEFDTWTAKGYRLLHIETYLSGGQICYAPIFVKSPGPGFVAYHGRTAAEHQAEFNKLTKDGWRPVNISVVSPGGDRRHTALYEKRDVGSFFTKSFLTPAEYQTHFNANVEDGRKLVYLNAYTHDGSPRITAIWNEKASSPFSARHGLSSGGYQTEFDKHLGGGFLTRAVAGYEENDGHRFAALWSK